MTPVLNGLLIIEAVLTLVAVVMFIRHGLLEFREEDDLILSKGEAKVASQQLAVQQLASTLERRMKQVSIAWGVVLVAIVTVWVLRQLY